MSEKLQKVLSTAGFGARRTLETWIADGRVVVNGVTAKVGDRVTAQDKILVDGRLVKVTTDVIRVLAYNKPVSEICTRSDPEGRTTVFDNLPTLPTGRWIAIGRLDVTTTGLLLFTNHGELANRLMHPSSEIEREYLVRVLGEVDGLMLERFTKGIKLEDGIARFKRITCQGGRGANQWYRVILTEGRNREVRRVFESQGLTVSRLTRIRFGNIILPDHVRTGRFRELTTKEIQALTKLV